MYVAIVDVQFSEVVIPSLEIVLAVCISTYYIVTATTQSYIPLLGGSQNTEPPALVIDSRNTKPNNFKFRILAAIM